MLGDGGDTPSGHELLSMVKKHSNLIGKTIVEVQDASDIEMDPRFWHDVMDLYFVRGKESRGRQDDDLVFFVRKVSSQGYGFKEYVEDDSPYFVRSTMGDWGLLLGLKRLLIPIMANESSLVSGTRCVDRQEPDYEAFEERHSYWNKCSYGHHTKFLKEAGIFSSVISAATQSGEAKEQLLNIVESSNNSSMDCVWENIFRKWHEKSDFHVNSRRVLGIRDQFSLLGYPSIISTEPRRVEI